MTERDTTKALPVIDGPCKGQRFARDTDEFSLEFRHDSKTKTHLTYCLRRHPLLGLVWAFPTNKAVSKVD